MVKSALALGAILASGPLFAAPESLSKVDTDKGEVLLEVLATGIATAKIIKVSTFCDIRANASTKDEATKLMRIEEQKLLAGIRAAGLNAAIIDFSAPSTMNSAQYEVAADAAAAAADAAAGAVSGDYGSHKRPVVGLSHRVGVSTGSAIDMQIARGVFAEFGCEEDYQMVRRPNVELADPAGAKAKATTAAIATAKAQAENYAAALNLRVVRMLRVSETGAIREFLGPESEIVMQEMRNDRDRRASLSNDVPISASISVDFVLGPKN